MLVKHSNRLELGILYSVVIAFFCINYFWLFALTAPSDPLQYVAPALNPQYGFTFLDRTLLWIWIRLCSTLPIDSNQIGGISTLLLTTGTLALGVLYCFRKGGFISASLFAILYIATPTIVDIASYTYPMQLLTFVLVVGLVFIDSSISKSAKAIVIGVVFSLAILSKIQGYIFSIFSFIYLVHLGGNIKSASKLIFISAISSLSTLLMVFAFLGVVDGWSTVKAIFEQYVNSNASVQYAGRAAGGIPNFYYYLAEPTSILALFGLIVPLTLSKFKVAIIPACIGAFQLFGILLVYIITQRGGPVISNYFLDSHVFGTIAFSLMMSVSLADNKVNKNLVTSILAAFFVYYAYLALTLPVTDSSYFPEHIGNEKSAYFLIVYLSLAFFSVIYFKFNKCLSSTLLFFAVVLFVLPRMYQGVQGAKFRKEFHEGYHVTSELIRSLVDEGKSVWVDVSTNYYKESVYSNRLKQVYRAFFSKGQISDSMVRFSQDRPDEYDVLLTTNPAHAFDEMPTLLYRDGRLKVNENEALTAKEVNTSEKIDYKVIGYRGFPLFEAKTYEGRSNLSVYTESDRDFLSLISYSKSIDLSEVEGQAIMIKANDHIEGLLENSSLDLFVQYLKDDTWTRRTVNLDQKATANGVSSIKLTTFIPTDIQKLEYGWRVASTNGVNAPLILPTPSIYMLRDKKTNTIEYKKYTYWVLE